jgi:hypothetical protein
MEFDLKRTTELLAATPQVVRSMTAGLSEAWTSSAGRDDWGPFDVVGHLIHGELTDWIPRARIILEQGEDTRFVPFDRLAQFELSEGKSHGALLDEFEQLRRENLRTLAGWELSDEQLELKGIHPEFGPVTLGQLLATWAVHDLTHIRQIATSMAKRYDSAVGPWKEYLSVLK